MAAPSSRVLRASLPQSAGALRPVSSRLPTIATSAFHQSAIWREEVKQQSTHNEPITRFEDLAKLGLVHPNVINVLTKKMNLDTMTDVQTRTINEALSGVDV